ncbi:glycosyltransferase family 2 protein [Hymenobacter sp. RP-2-7]|uniref:Glycosyltransferase family 2 protein n=1 Tax=Hymenobacter polaris TaxID=2682546 RepID=A0A7Y0AIN7_9BACT|nr:glycosyltransferase family 2 protein [Hymenobacter polaris]NML68058.1 glycosyltransferase family 2 protein [Hymenobacter polaris]
MKNKLGIFIITYNRANLLAQTLDFLASSLLKSYHITVLDNASTDDTALVVSNKKNILPNLEIVTNHVNVGPNANFMRAFDYGKFEYTWVICDDDVFDLNHFDDVLKVIEEGKVDLIHVGAHKQDIWSYGGYYKNPSESLAMGYAYFKFASFMPCNIFKTDLFVKKYLIPGYNNIGNAYPHMPFAFGIYSNNVPFYIAQHQIVFAQEGQHYSVSAWFIWWMKTCELLIEPSKVRLAYLNQWKDNGIANDEPGLKSLVYAKSIIPNSQYIENFINTYFDFKDRKKILKYEISDLNFKNKVIHIFYKIKESIYKSKYLFK